MNSILRQLMRVIPTLVLSFVLALVVWISSVTAADPIESRLYPRPVQLEVIGQDRSTVLTSKLPNQIELTLSAPHSVWDRLINDPAPVRAIVDLSGVEPGTHELPVHIQVSVSPVKVVSYSPRTVDITLEAMVTRSFPVHLITRGSPTVGFEAGTPVLNQENTLVSGPESIVARVKEVQAVLDMTGAREPLNQTLNLKPVDATGATVNGLSLSPDQAVVTVSITQRGGYRNVVVKVIVNGQIANGYRLTNMSVFPPVVTVFSADPQLVNNLPGFIETAPLDLRDAKNDLDVHLKLNLPQGVTVVGDQTVEVVVGIAAIEGSLTLSNKPIEIIGLTEGLTARTSPETIDVILSGPLPELDALVANDVKVVIDLTGENVGTYQRSPRVDINNPDLKVESILPSSVEVVVSLIPGQPAPTVTPKITPSTTVTPTSTPTP